MSDGIEADAHRIQAHLASVESDLRDKDTAELSPQQRSARAANLERLSSYRRAGLFPRNPDFIGERMPYFVDSDGRHCAVAYLVQQSGHQGLVEEIRTSQNNAKLLNMDSAALSEWVASSGLSAQELASIQPAYCGCPGDWAPVCGSDGVTYGNTCFAEVCAGVEVVHEGPCDGDDGPQWPEAGSSTGDPSDASSTGSSASTGEPTTGGTTTDGGVPGDEPDEEADGNVESVGGGCGVGVDPSALAILVLIAGRRRR